MYTLSQSLRAFLKKKKRFDIISSLMFGKLEAFTDDLRLEYLKWLDTIEGRSYLKGGANYKE